MLAKQLAQAKHNICPTCKGTGLRPDAPPDAVLVSREDAETIEDVLRLAASSSNDADEVDNLTRLAAKMREGQ